MAGNNQLAAGSDALKISVAIATYNGSRFLREQLDSLTTQSHLPFELVVTDDGSTDQTIAIIEDFAASAPFPVHVHRNAGRLGYADNFLRAASLCKGDLVSFCDQDDVWLPSKLETCAGYFAKDRSVQLVVHCGETWDGVNRLARKFPSYDHTESFEPGTLNPLSLVPGFAMVFRRDLLEMTNNASRPGCPFGIANKSIMAHDSWVWLLATSIGKTVLLSDVLALYRQHPTNTVGAPKKRTMRAKIALFLGTDHYAGLGELEEKAGGIVTCLNATGKSEAPEKTKAVADRLARRGNLHSLRARLYAPQSSFATRLRSLFAIASKGGYGTKKEHASLGFSALAKDLIFGLPGIVKAAA